MQKSSPKGSRRTFLRGVAAATVAGSFAGFPHIARSQAKTIRIGMPTILSGRVAMLGSTSRIAAHLVFDAANRSGGINGRMIELIDRDTKGAPDVAAKTTRDMINTDGCEIILDGEASAAAFAIHEVIRDLPVLCVHTNCEVSSLTADPKLFVKTAFRSCRQGIHDAVAGGVYASKLAREKGLRRWMTCSPDYAFGRDNTAQFIEFLKRFDPSIEIADQVWPKLFAPDYTESITKILQVRPQAFYSALWGGDLVAFVEQANLYRLLDNTAMFSTALGDTPVLSAIHQLPPGLNTGYRYSRRYPDSPANTAFANAFAAVAKYDPTGWAWQTYVGASFIVEALKRTGGKTDGAALAAEIEGMKLPSPLGVDGTLTMRAADHTLINYPVAWSRTAPKPPFLEGFVPVDWHQILELETEWKKSKGYL
ncbi:ABC transporter substrate-binding protein [Paraburkholderia caribensis]|uniref:ABC transporter substrate-binding protein n=1 Tax=Paraburkholderia caribensis TaxID=75105 RepID=UPI00078EE444|nr:ABC transporter substrate-binding protein [Paraburkholderia caribensis]AMV48328.1 ABC transporter substrate-binding protein [Paraburkholderia caribensis]